MLRHVEGPDRESLTFDQTAAALGIGRTSLKALIAGGKFPAGVPLGGNGPLRWPWLDVVAFMHLSARLPSAQPESKEKPPGRRRPPEVADGRG